MKLKQNIGSNQGLETQVRAFRIMGIAAILAAMISVFATGLFENSTITQSLANLDVLRTIFLFVVADFCAHKAFTKKYNYLEKENEVLNSQLAQLELELRELCGEK